GGHATVERRVPLPARPDADRQQQAAFARKRDPRALARLAAGDLEKTPDAEPAPLAAGLGLRPAGGKAGGVGPRQRIGDDRGELAAVEDGAERACIRKLRRGDQVAAAKLDRVDADLARGSVDQPLDAVIRLGPPGAAIGAGRHGVGEDAADAQPDLRDVVHARETAGEIRRRDEGAVRGQVGAHRGKGVDVDREELAVAVEREPSLDERVASQCTARPVCFAATRSAAYSGYDVVRMPNAPPTSPVTTRTRPEATAR